jgi:hypothetical protein
MSEEKDSSIGDLVAALALGARGWVLVDHWPADRCAIGIASERDRRRLVYVSTYGKEPGRFAYDCEAPCGPDVTDFRSVDARQDASLPELLAVIERHLAR